MHIMTTHGWKQLAPRCCDNQVWERQSFNAITKKWERDDMTGTLRHVDTVFHAEPTCKPFNEQLYWQSVNLWCRRIQDDVREMQTRRAGTMD